MPSWRQVADVRVRLQTGQVQNYALCMLLGAVGLLFWYVVLK